MAICIVTNVSFFCTLPYSFRMKFTNVIYIEYGCARQFFLSDSYYRGLCALDFCVEAKAEL